MTDNTRVNELQEKLLKAIDILNAQALNSISFDKTITCKIENDKDKKDGKYEVNDGNRIFTAYSTDTSFRTDDTVYVTVPEGKFENQKMIIGKKTADNDKPFNFTQPFNTFFDMTGNLAVGAVPVEAVANYEDDKRITILCQRDEQGQPAKDPEGNIIPLNVSNKDIIKYTRLAIRANFRSWIKNAISGNYGIDIILTTDKPNTTTGDTKNGTYTYRFDSSMFYGNPYNFETYYSQELVLDLEKQDIGKVTGIRVDFYQDEPFKNREGIALSTVDMDGGLLAHNLFVNNLEIYFGYDISIFDKDYVEIYTQNKNSYKRSTSTEIDNIDINKKEIKMRWVHIKDGIPTDMAATIEQITEEEKLNYEIRWYRYRVGAVAADEYCGIYWEQINVLTKEEWENAIEEIKADSALTEEEKNSKIKEINNIYYKYSFKYVFHPDVNKKQEKIKAIIIYKEGNMPYRSNELLFENEEDLPPSKEAQHIMNALVIECDDETDGNYMVYGQDNSIKDTAYGKETRTLTAYFDANNDGIIDKEKEMIQQFDNLEWIFPTKNTMILLLNGRSYDKIELISYMKNTYYIKDGDKYKLDNSDKINPDQTYYQLIEQRYIEVTNLYRPNTYYIQDYVNCKDLKFNSIENTYYIYNKEKEEYEKITLSLSDYEKNRENYYIYTYILYSEDELKENLVYYQYNISNSGKVTNTKPQYKIDSYYSPTKSNNTVVCQYTLNGVVYTTEKEFTFGPAGTMGSDQTLIIDFVGDKNSVIEGEEVVNFEIQLYDNQNKQQLIPDGSVTWAWYYNSDLKDLEDSDGNLIGFPQDIKESKDAIWNSDYKFKINSLYILQASVGNLTTYFPIPVSESSGEYSYIKGATQVIYQSNGEPSYNREEYQLFKKDDSIANNISWKICHNINEKDEKEKLLLKFIGQLSKEKENKGHLQPLAIYTKDGPVYGVQAFNDKTIVWSQPILVLQNLWPNGVINTWDGKSLVLNEEDSTVLASAISAGKKNSDNTFSGVMMGDWKGKDVEGSITKQTGVYGFHHGAISYALTEDGKAFFGKDGQGRIYINGDDATLYSPGFKTGQGMKIDLSTPYIAMKEDKDTQFKLFSDFPFQIGEKFQVAWDGTIYAIGGKFQGTISASILQTNKFEDTIYLRGSITVQQKGENDVWKTGGKIGFLGSDYGGEAEGTSKNEGIGLNYNNISVMKVTNTNAGLSCADYFLSLQNINGTKKAVLRSTKNGLGRLVLDEEHIGLGFGATGTDENTGEPTGGAFITLEKNNGKTEVTIGADKISFSTSTAADQEGIYARFA